MGNTPSSSRSRGVICSASTVVTERATGSHVLRVNSYEDTMGHGVGKSINSGTFTAGGHSWYIAFFPDGEREGCVDWVSVFLCLHHRPPAPAPAAADDDVVVKARIEFMLLDGKGRLVAWKKTTQGVNFSPQLGSNGSPRYGYRKLVKRSRLMDGGGLQIWCDVTVIKVRVEATTAAADLL